MLVIFKGGKIVRAQQRRIAKSIGISEPQLSRIIQGKAQMNPKHFKALQQEFGIPFDFWVELAELSRAA